MKRLFVILLVILCGGAHADSPLVILLSWDGMRHDFPDRGDYPGLQRMEAEGIRAGRLTPVYPSATFPGHVSLATGAPPSVHGILDNNFFDRKKGKYSYSPEADWIAAEPVWITAERQGVKAATYFWVGSETDWHGQGQHYRIAPFDAYRDEADKVAQIIAWIDLPPADRPGLIMSYWSGADGTAHIKGPDHPDVNEAIAGQDRNLQTLMQAIDERQLWPSTTLLLVSDHGMTEVNESVEIKSAIEDAGLGVRVFGGNAVQHLFIDNADDEPKLMQILDAAPHVRAFEGEAIPAELRFPGRTGDVVVTTEPPYTLSRSESLRSRLIGIASSIMGWRSGAHGYDPTLADMGGIFFAMGRGVSAGKKIDNVSQLQVAPTVTSLLGIDPPRDARAEPVALE
ncbi:MAG: alkaline phosphatase family protein [Pseudomonadales bacterium]|nr:alkaline phosphatase family protein [Pseudomonadales bacterium]